ncbi:hypothetical protein F1654_03780 [Alkalicaulis satelles]|uniref:Uncharacterized protein n=1 Tax=Alkalicaulis satelles TaxID=2609175 RepID=A0A5M6ZN39_9PROT|nr:hypothetical protein [Alkalicaulis satelles]KAA5805117.1 hypothetical protein F1654_03780 [Alkalicaulis satelles]
MTRPDDEFDAVLHGLFEEAAPPAHDADFNARVMARLPAVERWRAVLVTGAALAGAAVASLQAAPLLGGLTDLLNEAGALAAGAVGEQAIAMGLVSAGALALCLVLSWRELR